MDIFHEMKKYHTARSPEGYEQFNIPLKPDEDGMIGRECPIEDCQPKYFKIMTTVPNAMSEKMQNFSQLDITCPYCGYAANMQLFHTESQIEWIKSMIFRDAARTVQNIFKKSFRTSPSSTKGIFSITLKFKPGPLPSVRHYVEQKLKTTVTCDHCGFQYAVYGISFHCPLCAGGNLTQHLSRSADIIRVLLEEHERISIEKGEEVGRQMLGNALEDVVSLFEAFLKQIYHYELKRRFPPDKAETKIKKIRNSFQRLDRARDLFVQDIGYDIFTQTNSEDHCCPEEFSIK